MKNSGVSVLICCYNSAERLPATLDHLLAQKMPPELDLEIIVIDNCSTDNTFQVAESYIQKFSDFCEYRIVSENNPGLSSARSKGISESTKPYILFCDDDNWLAENYIFLCYDMMEMNPDMALCGGLGIPAFDGDEPGWFKYFSRPYAVGAAADQTGVISDPMGFVVGAGMFLRRYAWEKIVERGFKSILTDRKGQDLSSGGDLEICYAMRIAGFKIGYNNEAVFRHFINRSRLTLSYLERLHQGIGRANVFLTAYQFVLNNMRVDKSYMWLKTLLLMTPALFRHRIASWKNIKEQMEYISLKAYCGEMVKQGKYFDEAVLRIKKFSANVDSRFQK